VAFEDTVDKGAMGVFAARQACGFHMQDAVDVALELDVPAGVIDADLYLTDAERRITVARWLP
jgi:outer membrane lipopolysaccharide assembly protein LptE/RlpB